MGKCKKGDECFVNTVTTNFLHDTPVGGWVTEADVVINGFLSPLAEIFVPFINDFIGFMLPKVHTQLATCATMYDNVYFMVQTRFCPAVAALATAGS